MNDIFKKINPQENWLLTQMSKNDLEYFLVLVNNYLLEYRNSLNIVPDLTFGLEIECDKLNIGKAQKIIAHDNAKFLNNKNAWQVTTDISLNKGCEINSPILKNDGNSWLQLYEICNTLQRHAKIKKTSGAHVHIGTNIINENIYVLWQFLQLWMTYEDVIYRFSYGEFLTPRPHIMNYAYPIANIIRSRYKIFQSFIDNNESIEEFFNYLFTLLHRLSYNRTGRNEAVNFNNVDDFHSIKKFNTIEFRCPNGTLNPIIWQNNINLFASMLTNNKLFQQDLILKHFEENSPRYKELKKYQEIYLDEALEFCDLVFAHNIDKVYFLRQYLKNYEVSSKILKKGKPFTR